MNIRWNDTTSLTVDKMEAESKMTAIMVDQLSRIMREIDKRQLLYKEGIIAYMNEELERLLGVPPIVRSGFQEDGFVVVTQARATDSIQERSMFLVDRSRVHHSWWSDDLEDALVYRSRGAAEKRASTLKFNHATVIDVKEAMLLNRKNDEVVQESIHRAIEAQA